MSTFEICKKIHDTIISKSTEESWNPNSDDFQIRVLAGTIVIDPDFKFIDISDLNTEEMKTLGFRLWDNKSPMLLIPLWLFHFVEPELEVICIDGTTNKFKDADDDHRAGLLAYGLIPKL